jgi:plastocyanin
VEKLQEQFFPGSSNSFAITFEKAGTYDYTCIFHPWMTGQVVVK